MYQLFKQLHELHMYSNVENINLLTIKNKLHTQLCTDWKHQITIEN